MFNRSNKIDRVLTKCILSIEKEGWTVDDCLSQYPAYRKELEPMLRTALKLRQASKFRPSATFRSNAQSRIHRRIQASRRSPNMGGLAHGSLIPKRTVATSPRLRLAGSLIPLLLLALLFMGAGGGIAYAADNARPGDALFPIDQAIEKLRIQLENDAQQTVRLHLQFADERIEEVIELIQEGKSVDLGLALASYKEQIFAAAPLIQTAQSSGENIGSLVVETSNAISIQKEKLQDLIQTVPDEMGMAIRDTIEDAEKIRKVVVSPIPVDLPDIDTTPESLVFEPEIPGEKTTPYIRPTTSATSAPSPGVTITPRPYATPTKTPIGMPPATATATSFPYATPTPIISGTPTWTPTFGTITPTPTGSISPTPTRTRTPTPTRTISPTPTKTRTPTPTGTPTPTNTPFSGATYPPGYD